nr:hypothetical protein BaRGS_032886 [Batillaria attramentaria]
MTSEFINPFDQKDNGSYPVVGENGELYVPFFRFIYNKRLEVELIPIELKLVAYVEIFWIIKIRKTIWQWSADPIRGTIWEKKISKEDKEPPEFQYCDELSEHWARNSQGLETTARCSIPTYDCTFPDGRVDAAYNHNEYLQDCELQEVTEGARAERRSDGHFVTYERLGKSFIAILRYEDLPLRHVNWDGFKDEECGIHGYTFAVGTTAVNDVIHGGDLVTTVCHSTPFLVDTTPPLMNSVDEVLFDETFRFLVVYYNASDVISGVARMEFGLGKD